MRKFALVLIGAVFGSQAFAADLPVKAPYYKAPPYFSWTGWYVGVNGGGGWGKEDPLNVTETFFGTQFFASNFGAQKPSGGFGGGQIGYNWQSGPIVTGFEADFQGAGIRGSQQASVPYIALGTTKTAGDSSNLDWFGTVRGRLGYAWDRFLVYGTGGFAYGNVRYGFTTSDTFGFTSAVSSDATRSGYTVGGGVEYAFAPRWSLKVEYQYLNFGSTTLRATEVAGGAPTFFAISTRENAEYHTVRAGVNYHF